MDSWYTGSMTTGQLLAATVALGLVGAGGLAQVSGADVSWKDVASSGAAGIVIVVVVVFLRHMGEARKEQHEHVQRMTTTFAESVESSTKLFAETAKSQMQALQEIVTTIHDHRAR